MTDLVERLRSAYDSLTPGAIALADLDGIAFTVSEAADSLSALEAELAKAREAALEEAAKESDRIADAVINALEVAIIRKSTRAKMSAAVATALRALQDKAPT